MPVQIVPTRVVETIISVDAGAQFDSFRPTTLGTLFSPGNDRPFLTSRGAATGFRTEVSVGFGRYYYDAGTEDRRRIVQVRGAPAPTDFPFTAAFSYSRSEATASGASAPGQIPVITLLTPFNGGTVAGFGTADASIVSSKITIGAFFTQNAPITNTVTASLGANFVHREVEHDGRISSGVLPGFFVEQRLATTDTFVGPRIGLGFRDSFTFGPSLPPVILSADGFLAPSLRISSGSARQHFVIPGAAPPFNDFTVDANRNNIGFALIGGFNAGADVAITNGITVGLRGGFVFNTNQSYLDVPVSPGQVTQMRSTFQPSGFIGATLRIRLP